MKKVGVLISDAKLQFEVMEALKREDLPFEIVQVKKKLPREFGVVLTTEEDKGRIKTRRMIVCTLDNLDSCIRAAKAAVRSKGKIKSLVIGIDPGTAPGIAVLADNSLIDSVQVVSPEAVADAVNDFLETYRSDDVLVRIGHGDRTRRNRIFNSIWDLEILTPGYRPKRKQLVQPSEGEISDTQRISRIGSGGEITISRTLAKLVAKGEISMEEAIERQRAGKKRYNSN